MKKKWLLVITVFIIILNVIWLFTYNQPDEKTVSGLITFAKFVFQAASNIGRVFITLTEQSHSLIIDSPLNTTYDFDNYYDNFSLDLNVSVTEGFVVENYWFSLIDRDNNFAWQNILFEPNISFSAVRYSNLLMVYANNSAGSVLNTNVTFFINVSNTAPVIQINDSVVFGCEDSYLSYYFNATDVDGDYIYLDIVPIDPFYILFYVTESPPSYDPQVTYGEIFSGYLGKSNVGDYIVEVSANDGSLSDVSVVNISILEINHAPVLDFIPSQTVWVDENFSYVLYASDVEDDVLNYNISFLNNEDLFQADSTGRLFFQPNITHNGTYNISACAYDMGIDAHENISYCGQDGNNMSHCRVFSFTVTHENRKPNITSFYPLTESFSVMETRTTMFNISKYDEDGTNPTTYWWLDNNSLLGIGTGDGADQLNYSFSRGMAGSHFITAEISDGDLNDSVAWFISVTKAPEPSPPSAGGGGGGGAGDFCEEKWGCHGWSVCQNLKKSGDLLDNEDYNWIEKQCKHFFWNDYSCGFQVRQCSDVNNCSTYVYQPTEIQECQYTENPNCEDGIKNCHKGLCEILIDCGGPCKACPTCSDGIQNQKEEGIDCGGPCPWPCPEEKPSRASKWWIWLLILIIIGLLLFLAIKVFHLRRIIGLFYDDEDEEKNKQKTIINN